MKSTFDLFLTTVEDTVNYKKHKENVKYFLDEISKGKYPFKKDLIQIAVYMYILWLKRGFHLIRQGAKSEQNITPEIKSLCFSDFKFAVSQFADKIVSHRPLRDSYIVLKYMIHKPFNEIYEVEIVEVFTHIYYAWENNLIKGE